MLESEKNKFLHEGNIITYNGITSNRTFFANI